MDLYVQYAKGSIWNSTELAEKAISAPNRQGLHQEDVEGNINSTDKTIKDIRLTKTAHVDPHQRGMSNERASDWHVRNTWIDNPHRQGQFYNDMQ